MVEILRIGWKPKSARTVAHRISARLASWEIARKSERAGGLAELPQLVLGICIGPVHQHGDRGRLWNQLMQHAHSLSLQVDGEKAYARDIAARPIEGRDQAKLDRVRPRRAHVPRWHSCRYPNSRPL